MPRIKAEAKTPTKIAKKSTRKRTTIKATTKTPVKRKVVAKARIKATVKTRTKAKEPVKTNIKVTTDILALVEKIIAQKKHKQGGLKSLYTIDRILDKNNQRYSRPPEKLAAIVHCGVMNVPTIKREPIAEELLKVLSSVGQGKVEIEEAKEQIKQLYKESSHEK